MDALIDRGATPGNIIECLCYICSSFTADIVNLDFTTSGRWSTTGCSIRCEGKNDPNVRGFDRGYMKDVKSAAEDGCKLCYLIWQGFVSLPDGFLIYISVYIPSLSFDAHFEVHAPVSIRRVLMFSLVSHEGSEGPRMPWQGSIAPFPSFIGMKRKVASRSDSQECFNLARSWLEECATRHPHCKRPESPFLPTRVIDVTLEDGSQIPRLHVSQSERGKYAALSHCWGTSVRLVTKTSNIGDLLTAIPFDAMAQNFQDAVEITRQLGLRYLWIDSFCIIQDSDADWRRESSNMASVYKNSFVTISAMDSSDSNNGIFCCRSKVIYPITARDTSGGTRVFGITPDYEWARGNSVLNSRAWVMQESILSTAKLEFRRSRITWECNSYSFSEDDPLSKQRPIPWLRLGFPFFMGRDLWDPASRGYAWLALVQQYSRKHLTMKSDRLPAISALAKVFAKAFKTRPLAGIWYEDIHRGLLWFRDKRHVVEECLVAVERRIPSWSWTAIDDPVVFFTGPGIYNCHNIQRLHTNTDMDFIDARITLTAKTTRVVIKWAFIQVWAVATKAMCFTISPENRKWASEAIVEKSTPKRRITLRCILDIDVPESDFICYCVRVANFKVLHHMYPNNPYLAYFLILKRLRPRRPNHHPLDLGTFERIGICTTTLKEADYLGGKSHKKFLTII